ncbi:MAG: M23 family metallopeptidase [Patescibacteria group bacterium]
MSEFRGVVSSEVNRFLKRQLKLLLLFILKIISPYILITSILVVAIFGVALFLGRLQIVEADTRDKQSVLINGELKAQDKTVEVNGINYPLPRVTDLSEKDFYALMVLRVAEFGNRQDFELAGMEDSCSLYQQRISELIPSGSLETETRNLLGEIKYNTIFTSQMTTWLDNNSWTARTYRIPITSTYGYRRPLDTSGGKTSTFHAGVDFGYSIGTPIVSPFNGVVTYLADTVYGKVLVIHHESIGIYTLYLHVDSFSVEKGNYIVAGQQIAISGNTGKYSTGPHLHYQILNEFKGINSNWKENTLDPLTSYNENLLFIQQPFFGACRMLTYEQIDNGFFDKLQLLRLQKKKLSYKDFNLRVDSYDQFLTMLVTSHAPRADTIPAWKQKAKDWLIPARINKAYQTYLDLNNS